LRILLSSGKSECTSCHQQGHAASKTLVQQNPPVVIWQCCLTHVDLCNGHKMTIVVVEIN